MGQKEDDLIGAWGCSHCHDLVDGRIKCESMSPIEIHAGFMDAIIRTQRELIRSGIIK